MEDSSSCIIIKDIRNSLQDKVFWIEKYIKNNGPIDIYNMQFVDDYIEQFSPKHLITNYGANKCKEISVVLKSGYDQGIFERSRVGLINHMWGYPNWVYVYSLKNL